MNNFWKTIERPIVGLAPMDGITDAAMRFITKKYGGGVSDVSIDHIPLLATDNPASPAEAGHLDSRLEIYPTENPSISSLRSVALGNDDQRNISGVIRYPNVIFNEFVSTDGLKAGAVKILRDLRYSEIERPVVAQLYGINPQAFYESVLIVCALGFDGVDINMGCPAKSVEQRGAGAGLINNRELAGQIVQVCKRAIRDWGNGIDLAEAGVGRRIVECINGRFLHYGWNDMGDGGKLQITNSKYSKQVPNNNSQTVRIDSSTTVGMTRGEIPLSVKTRIGFKERDLEWMKKIASWEVAAVTIHGRVFAQRHSGVVDWEGIAEASEILKEAGSTVLGNGGIKSLAEAKNKTRKFGIDGVLIGQAAVGNPWVFRENFQPADSAGKFPISNFKEVKRVVMEHARKYEELYPGESFMPMRKHLAWYIRGCENATEMRKKLVLTSSSKEVEKLISEYK